MSVYLRKLFYGLDWIKDTATGAISAGVYPDVARANGSSYVYGFPASITNVPIAVSEWTTLTSTVKWNRTWNCYRCDFIGSFPTTGTLDVSSANFGDLATAGLTNWGVRRQLTLSLQNGVLGVEGLTLPSSLTLTGQTSSPYPTEVEWEPIQNQQTGYWDSIRFRTSQSSSAWSLQTTLVQNPKQKWLYIPRGYISTGGAAQYADGVEYDLYYRFETTGNIDGPLNSVSISVILDAETGKRPTADTIGHNPGEVGNPPYYYEPYGGTKFSTSFRFGLSPHGNGTVWNAAPNAHAQEI